MTTPTTTDSTLTDAINLEEPNQSAFRRVIRIQAVQMLILLAALMLLFAILKPDTFLTASNLRNIVQGTSIYAVLGVGQTLVIITSGIDLSIGSVLVFSAVVSATTMNGLGGQGWGVILIGLLVACASGTAWGFINGFVITKTGVPPLIVTLGSMTAALGLAQVLTNGIDITQVPTALVNNIGFGNLVASIPTLAIIAAVVVIIGIVVLHQTKFGLLTYAIGSNPEAARRVGIRVDPRITAVYMIAGFCAGLGGWLNLAFYQSTTISGQANTPLNIIAGVAIGGTSLFGGVGSIFGSVIGLFIPTTLQNGFVQVGIQPFWQQVVVGFLLVAIVYIDQLRRRAAASGPVRSAGIIARLFSRNKKG